MSETKISPCACMGPRYGEPYCECVMFHQGLDRSEEWQKANSKEALAEQAKRLDAAMKEVFANNRKIKNEDIGNE